MPKNNNLTSKSIEDIAINELSIQQISSIILKDWKKPYFGAMPYLEAMYMLDNNGMYGLDDWNSIVLYFLSNAVTWRGDTARVVKAELNRRLKRNSLTGSTS